MNCQKCKIEIEDRDLRRESLSDAAETHLETCAACRGFAGERLALRRLVGGLEKISAPADFDFRMRARLAAERSAVAPRAASWFNFSPAALAWPLAGCLALVASASLYFQAQRPDATPVAQSPAPTAPVNSSPQISAVAAAGGAPQGEQTLSDEIQPRGNGSGVEFAAAKSSAAAGRRRAQLSAPRAVRAGVERASARIEETASLSLTGSTPRFASSAPTRTEGVPIPVQLDAPEGQLKVLLRDTSGAARTISVDSVSFGSRDVETRRPGATYTKASLSSNRGVW